jgi:hypothetical protein
VGEAVDRSAGKETGKEKEESSPHARKGAALTWAVKFSVRARKRLAMVRAAPVP